MRIAFLVQCHKCAEQINMLTRILSSDQDDVYIHLDRKNTDDRERIHTNDNIFLLPPEKTVSVEWGGFSQCAATMSMINEVMACGKKYDYIWLMSGQDIPVRRMCHIKKFLTDHAGVPFIHVLSQERTNELCFEKRNDIVHHKSLVGKKVYQRILRRVIYFITGGKKRTFGIFKKRRPTEKLFYGSSWWCLPYDCVSEMMWQLSSMEGYIKYFSTSLCSDESFFQTLFMQTRYAGKQAGNLTYVDWSAGGSNPKVFTKEDYHCLISLPEHDLLARKIDMDLDSELVRMLEKHISADW